MWQFSRARIRSSWGSSHGVAGGIATRVIEPCRWLHQGNLAKGAAPGPRSAAKQRGCTWAAVSGWLAAVFRMQNHVGHSFAQGGTPLCTPQVPEPQSWVHHAEEHREQSEEASQTQGSHKAAMGWLKYRGLVSSAKSCGAQFRSFFLQREAPLFAHPRYLRRSHGCNRLRSRAR